MMAIISTGCLFFDLFLILGVAAVAVYVSFLHSYQYWKKRDVPYLKPKFPYGNNITLIRRGAIFAGEARYWYEDLKRKGHKFGGAWSYSRKVLVLVDPDYIKDILTQDFQYFTDRDIYSDPENDPLSAHLFSIPNPYWKPLRQKLTPTFTSGKMKLMFDSIIDCSNYMIQHMEKEAKIGEDIAIRDVLASFTTDVIGAVAFGVKSNSFDGKPNEFRDQSRNLFKVRPSSYFKIITLIVAPRLFKTFGLKFIPPSVTSFFSDLVRQTIDYRINNNIRRNDFLQLLIDMNQGSDNNANKISFEQMVANTVLFFIAGFDTSSTTMTFSLYQLAKNPDIQEKTREEIEDVLKKYDGKLTYDSLEEMTYLRQVIDESTRMFPPVLTLGRRCVKDYQLRNTDVVIEKGTPVVISTYGLGRDPEYYPDPDVFDPDRFTAENKAHRHQYVHLTFGEGPRNCIGLRFGVMQSKIGLIRILTNFKLSISPKTKLPVKIEEGFFLLKEKSPIYLKLDKI